MSTGRVHIWDFEQDSAQDRMHCGLPVYFRDDGSIVGDADFVINCVARATCASCIAAADHDKCTCARCIAGRLTKK